MHEHLMSAVLEQGGLTFLMDMSRREGELALLFIIARRSVFGGALAASAFDGTALVESFSFPST